MDFDDIPQSKEECKNNETNSNFDENKLILLRLLSDT